MISMWSAPVRLRQPPWFCQRLRSHSKPSREPMTPAKLSRYCTMSDMVQGHGANGWDQSFSIRSVAGTTRVKRMP